MPRLFLPLAILLALAASSCGAGGFACTKMTVLGLPNRAPVANAIVFSYRESTPTDRTQGYPLYPPGTYDPTALACSGELMIEIAHPNYETKTVRYRSPRDRTISGNTEVDTLTVELTPR